MSKKSARKEYQSMLSKFLFFLIVCAALYLALFTATGDGFVRLGFTIIAMPIIMSMVHKLLDVMFNFNTAIDIRIYSYYKLLSMDVDVVWTSPDFEREPLVYLEVKNIGESFIDRIQIVPNHGKGDRDKVYKIGFPCSKGEKIYFALPESVIYSEESNVSVVYFSNCKDTAKTFSGHLIDTGKYLTFSKISFSGGIKSKEKDKVLCIRFALKQMQNERLEQPEKVQ